MIYSSSEAKLRVVGGILFVLVLRFGGVWKFAYFDFYLQIYLSSFKDISSCFFNSAKIHGKQSLVINVLQRKKSNK